MLRLAEQLLLSRCPHCGADLPTLVERARFTTADVLRANAREWKGYACTRCGGVTFASCREGDAQRHVNEIFPNSARSVDEAVPTRAREYLEQALNSRNAPAGAVMLAASAVDAMLKAKSLSDGKLYARIVSAAQQHIITADMAAWAHEVRLDANDQRHADADANLPTAEDADHTIDFAMALAQFMFVLPSRVSRGLEEAKGVDK